MTEMVSADTAAADDTYFKHFRDSFRILFYCFSFISS